MSRCSEHSQEGAHCIYEAGHDGRHFAKDAFSYYSWETKRVKRRHWRIPLYFGFGGVVITIEPWTWRGLRARLR